jgi:hypothetical protein
VDGGRSALELAAAMGEQLTSDDVGFMAKYSEKIFETDESYRGSIDEDDRRRLIADPDDEPMASVLAILWEAAHLLWSEHEDALERMGVTHSKRVTAKTNLAAAVMFPHISRALSAPRTVLYSTKTKGAPDTRVICVSPPIIALGKRLLVERDRHNEEEDQIGDLELRFLLGRAAELVRPERVIAMGLPREDFAGLVASLRRVFGDGDAPDDEIADAVREHDTILRKTLPVKLRRGLKAIIEAADPSALHPERYIASCERAADRAGLLVCGDIATAIRMVGGKANAHHLLDIALRDEYLDVRAKLGIGVAEA